MQRLVYPSLTGGPHPPAEFTIDRHSIGQGRPVFLIAEIGINHNGSLSLAKRMVTEAARNGASAVKFQFLDAADLFAQESNMGGIRDLFRKCEFSYSEWAQLKSHADRIGVTFFASVFAEQKIDFLEALGVPCFKISSGDITYVQLLRKTARTRKPVILSTGMSNLQEVAEAIRIFEEEKNRRLVILHCVNSYPTRPRDTHLRKMSALESFGYPVGFSDHTLGIEISLAAVARGAVAIEKHFTIDRTLPGPDQALSITPADMRSLRRMADNIVKSIGDAEKKPAAAERSVRRSSRRSLVALKLTRRGERLAAECIGIKRPGTGIQPKEFLNIVGRKARRDIPAGKVLSWAMLGSRS